MKKIVWKEYVDHEMEGYSLVIPMEKGIPNMSQVLYLEGTALEMWNCLHENTIEETKRLLNEKYNAKEKLEKDLENLILEFQEYKLLEVTDE